jgi:hypothetical protein
MSLKEILVNYVLFGGGFAAISVGLGELYKRWLDKKEGYRW